MMREPRNLLICVNNPDVARGIDRERDYGGERDGRDPLERNAAGVCMYSRGAHSIVWEQGAQGVWIVDIFAFSKQLHSRMEFGQMRRSIPSELLFNISSNTQHRNDEL